MSRFWASRNAPKEGQGRPNTPQKVENVKGGATTPSAEAVDHAMVDQPLDASSDTVAKDSRGDNSTNHLAVQAATASIKTNSC